MSTPEPRAAATPAPVDLLAVLVDFQTQLNALNRAVTDQQAIIDALVDVVTDQVNKAPDHGRQ
jgi:hypothetical protein